MYVYIYIYIYIYISRAAPTVRHSAKDADTVLQYNCANQGISCYINSVVQAVLACPAVQASCRHQASTLSVASRRKLDLIKNRPKIDQKLTKNRPTIDQKSIKNRSKIDQKSIKLALGPQEAPRAPQDPSKAQQGRNIPLPWGRLLGGFSGHVGSKSHQKSS